MSEHPAQSPEPVEPPVEPSTEDVARCLAVLYAVELLSVDHPTRFLIEQAASRTHRGTKKRLRKLRQSRKQATDRALLERLSQARPEVAGVRALPSPVGTEEHRLLGTRSCYVCKQPYTRCWLERSSGATARAAWRPRARCCPSWASMCSPLVHCLPFHPSVHLSFALVWGLGLSEGSEVLRGEGLAVLDRVNARPPS